jgi:hypothetical protein
VCKTLPKTDESGYMWHFGTRRWNVGMGLRDAAISNKTKIEKRSAAGKIKGDGSDR